MGTRIKKLIAHIRNRTIEIFNPNYCNCKWPREVECLTRIYGSLRVICLKCKKPMLAPAILKDWKFVYGSCIRNDK